MNTLASPLLILGSFAAYAVLHSILAAHRVKDGVRGLIGEAAFERYYRLFFNVIGVLTLLPILWLVVGLPDQALYTIAFPWRWLSYAGQGVGLLLLADTLRQTGAADFLGLRQLFARGSAPALHG